MSKEFTLIVKEEVEGMFSDAEEIGSSDISICARNILDTAKRSGIGHTDSEFLITAIRTMIHEELSNMEEV